MGTRKTNLYSYFLNGQNPKTDSHVRLALEDLRDKSGLSAEILKRAQVKLFTGGVDLLKDRLGFASIEGQPILKMATLVEIPSFDAHGNITNHHYRLYPATNGRRYLHSMGSPARPYILTEVWAVKDKSNRPLWITEGAKKALKLAQQGRYAIALPGVWQFQDAHDPEETFLFDDLEQFMWRGRTIFLGFDMDLWTNPQVRFALYELALKLTSRGAIMRFPKWMGAKGIDDYLAGQKEPEKALGDLEDKAIPLIVSSRRTIGKSSSGRSRSARPGFDALGWESQVKRIAKKLGLQTKTLFFELNRDAAAVTDTGIVIAHPSYEINQTFMSLGFKETVLVDDKPQEKESICHRNRHGLCSQQQHDVFLGDEKIVFDMRERVLMSLSDKWHRGKLTAFVKDPTGQEGVYRELVAVLKRYLEFQDEGHYGLIGAWIVATYFHRCFNAFPFLFFYGKKQSGKSRALDFLERLSFNAIKVKGVSVPSLADSIDAVRATFLMDQAEIFRTHGTSSSWVYWPTATQ